MKKVYIVKEVPDYDDPERIYNVFSTRKKALEWIEKDFFKDIDGKFGIKRNKENKKEFIPHFFKKTRKEVIFCSVAEQEEHIKYLKDEFFNKEFVDKDIFFDDYPRLYEAVNGDVSKITDKILNTIPSFDVIPYHLEIQEWNVI